MKKRGHWNSQLEENFYNYPEINDIQESRKEDHDKQQLKPYVGLEGFKKNLSKISKRFGKQNHCPVDDNLGDCLNQHPYKYLICPMQQTTRSFIHTVVFQRYPVVSVSQNVNQFQQPHCQYQTQSSIHQIANSVPRTLIVQ